MTNFELVDSPDRFMRVMGLISRDRIVGIDIESNGFFRYPERICLIQISASGRVYLIDPLAIEDMSPLGKALADRSIQVVLHSGDNDVRSLDRDWGFRVGNLFDTSIAAAFAGIKQLGLASTLQEVMDVTIPKDKKVQRSDWTVRPLSDVALTYAAEDVRHLLGLRDKLLERLHGLGRVHWVEEECDRLSKIRQRGHPRLRMRHMPFPIDKRARDRWMDLMSKALEDCKFQPEVTAYLHRFFADTATFMINRGSP